MAETRKAHERRVREGWYERNIRGVGIDIGSGPDPIGCGLRSWDKAQGDATLMARVMDDSCDTVYASHVLEHLADPYKALVNWYRILRPGGKLIVCVPHRDLYEKRKVLPSRWNLEHKSFWLPWIGEGNYTFGLLDTLGRAIGYERIELIRVLDDGYVSNGSDVHSSGEYSIEGIVRK